MHSKISAHLIGHLTADPRPFDLPRTGGAGCELRLTIARPDFDANGGRITRTRYVKAVTYDTRLAAAIVRDYGVGDFVEVLADDVRTEKPWFSQRQQTWLSGGVTFTLTRIRKATALTPEDGQPDPGAELLDGVAAGTSQEAEPGPDAADEAAGHRQPAARRARRGQIPADDTAMGGREAAEPTRAA